MAQAPSYMAPGSEFELANQQAQRQRQLAQTLREQATQPLQGQMAGQMYVPPSWTQGLAQLLKGYTARKTDEAADTKLQDARTAYNTRNSASTQALVDALSGTPGQKAPEGSAQFGDIMETPDTPAQPPDINKALGVALGNQDNPLLAGFAGKVLDSKLSGLLPKTPKWEKYEKPDGQGGMVSGFVDVNSPQPLSTFQRGGAQPAKPEAVNGQFVNPYTVAPGTVIPKQADAANPRTELLVDDGTGKLIPNAPLIDARKQIAASGKTSITNNVNTDKSYFGNVAEGLAKQDVTAIDAGKGAPQRIQTAMAVKELLKKNPMTGTGAEARLSLNKALATAGIIDGTNVKDTETLASLLASQTMDAISGSGLGSGQGFTDKDRQFLERAKSGNIELNAGTIGRLADLNERAGRASIKRANSVIGNLRKSGKMGNVPFEDIPEPTSGGPVFKVLGKE